MDPTKAPYVFARLGLQAQSTKMVVAYRALYLSLNTGILVEIKFDLSLNVTQGSNIIIS